MTRRRLLSSGASVIGSCFLGSARAAAKRPNVVMFMTDDHGAWALGAYGCTEMHTPNIDALAKGGAQFTNAFAATPVCSPSRMTYMTGKLPSQHGVHDWLVPKDSFGPQARRWQAGHPTYSEALAKAGFTLGMVGKWHMGNDDLAQAGFSYWATIPGGGGPYKDVDIQKNGKVVKAPYKTDTLGEIGVEFVEQSKDKPFYLLMPFYAPHTPFDYQPEKYRDYYQGSKFTCYPRLPQSPQQNRGLAKHHLNEASMHAYSALISGVDANVGRVVKRIDDLGLRDNTLIIFTADQGWNAGQHGVWGKGNGTVPLNMLEESIRVPMVWNQPGRIRAGQTIEPLISSYDYFPSVLDYVGVSAPRDGTRVGRSYAGLLNGRKPVGGERDRLYFEYEYVRAVRTKSWKLIERAAPWESEMYDLAADPGETRNLYSDAAASGQREALSKDLRAFFKRMGAPDIEHWRNNTPQTLTEYQAIGK